VKIRALLTAAAIAAVAAGTVIAVPGLAGAANGPAPATTTAPTAPPLTKASFENGSGGVAVGKVAGVIPARGSGLKITAAIARNNAAAAAAAPAATATCTEPDCDLVYNGGPVQLTPHVYIVFWGSKWSSEAATENYLLNFYKGLGQTNNGDTWSPTVWQYDNSSGGHPTFGTSLLAGSWVDTTDAVPATVAPADLANEAAEAADHFAIPETTAADNDQIVIASQPGTCFAPEEIDGDSTLTFAGNCGTVQSTGYCAFHSYVTDTSNSSIYLPVVNLPYQTDAGAGCGENFVNAGSKGTDDGFSIDAGHETMETITDPLDNAWIDPNDDTSGGEVADKCAWAGEPFGLTDPVGNVALATGTFAVQSLWSNSAGRCSMDPVSVTTPAAQSSTLGKAVSLKISATVNSTTALTYTASGLPSGLTVNKTTGVISGTPGVTAGTFTPKVTLAYNDGSRSVSFSWKVSSAAGQLKGYDSKCLGDYNAKTTVGNKIVIWTCAAGAAQTITFAANSELQVVGSCVTGTATLVLGRCAAAASQEWTRLSNGEYVLKSNGRCLTAPSATNGTQLTVTACKDTANQKWALP
jgi:hypothetical protein